MHPMRPHLILQRCSLFVERFLAHADQKHYHSTPLPVRFSGSLPAQTSAPRLQPIPQSLRCAQTLFSFRPYVKRFHPQREFQYPRYAILRLLSFSMLFASSHCVFFHPLIVHFTALPFSIAQRKPSVWYPFFEKLCFARKMRFLHIFRLQREKITDIVGLTALSHEWHEWRKIHKMHQRNEKHERNT